MPEKPEKKMTPAQVAIIELKKKGYTQAEIAKMIDVSPSYLCRVYNSSIEKRYTLLEKTIVRDAYKALKFILKAEPFGKLKEVKDSTVMRAIEMVYERYEPVKQEISVEHTFTQVDLSAYKSEPIDITPEMM